VFAVSEQNFMAASTARQAELTEQLIQRSLTLRQLVRYLIDAAKKETDVAKARDMLKKIEACGTWLQAPSSTELVQQVGKALSMTAAKELEQLPAE
jgi:ribosomal protein L17